MFGIGMTELMVIFVIGLLVLGPKRLPELARSLGRTLAEFRRASTDLRHEFLDVNERVHLDPPGESAPPGDAEDPAESETPASETPAGETPASGTPASETPTKSGAKASDG